MTKFSRTKMFADQATRLGAKTVEFDKGNLIVIVKVTATRTVSITALDERGYNILDGNKPMFLDFLDTMTYLVRLFPIRA